MLVYLEDAQKKKYQIENINFKIGRDGSKCQLKLPNNRLFSALQAIIVIQEDEPIIEKFVLVDQSRNKNTYVNGKYADKRVLKHGDRITFAKGQQISFTFKMNTSEPTMLPQEEGWQKLKLEDKSKIVDLGSTIKIDSSEANPGNAKVHDKDVQDLRDLMQNNMTKDKTSHTPTPIQIQAPVEISPLENITTDKIPTPIQIQAPIEIPSLKNITTDKTFHTPTPIQIQAPIEIPSLENIDNETKQDFSIDDVETHAEMITAEKEKPEEKIQIDGDSGCMIFLHWNGSKYKVAKEICS